MSLNAGGKTGITIWELETLAERRVYPTQNPFCFKDSQIKEQNGPKQTEYYIIDIFQDNSYFKLASNMAAMCAATVCLTPERQVYKRQAG